MNISKPMILASLVVGSFAHFFLISDSKVPKLRILFTLENTYYDQLNNIISQPPLVTLAARDEQTEDCRRFKTCSDN